MIEKTHNDVLRPSRRRPDELRSLRFMRGFTGYAEGSVLVEFGATWVLCTASLESTVPNFLRGTGRGWITAEYGMLPRATDSRTPREAIQQRQGGRTLEIQRLIGRALRTCVDLDALGERTIILDCDVLQADGGTRSAAISGAWVALRDALELLHAKGVLKQNPLHTQVAAVSVGIYQGIPILDLDYAEDRAAETDLNLVMDNSGRFIEIQGTAEKKSFSQAELENLLALGADGIQKIQAVQRAAQILR